jgi:hypothetical protein
LSLNEQLVLSNDDLIEVIVKYDSYMVYNAYMTVIAWYLWRNDAYTTCNDCSINTWSMLLLKVLLSLIQYDDNLIDDNSEGTDVMMVLNWRKMIRVLIIAYIKHYCINYTDVLSYCYH